MTGTGTRTDRQATHIANVHHAPADPPGLPCRTHPAALVPRPIPATGLPVSPAATRAAQHSARRSAAGRAASTVRP
ncbi:MAG: hypothetical protein LC799_12525, partial [Actinobacteria bacterium]|nr:hypothetical protein [Actinomycetota bacterium]